ncbi:MULTISPECIES: sigma-54-dependent transcriptional regulator [Chryseobacterium]|uniref:Two-component system NtrC family response regulator n=1 Tax=Chryseobacterium camelliae TaxID=1265445 RepID=A0ABU0TJJ0_9FLAO|nr:MULTISPECIES: sigma-54 dependent transcriptional regulator [Chryseobacterium]MDT3408943.1 two-component system NtrC family response regulator [Pseudacidovorax intermedius]MDQ1097202.1 two-component system NtrC family response regulator [Chryseobacterium camelliae]MDQ1101137.1 two-component system NtrC family response regulator [Chryseobacterium sp. SORGH_AS_1048]MDR6084582.1 two-component system NtrC family response regulator [Chryseobacterium sp. SORGH_AS_0909]MDR6132852.1 two-component sy
MSGNILIIDDEIKLLKLLGMILSQEDFNVKQASTARSAMTMLEQAEYDVVLSDVRLPDAFGVELVKSIKAKYPHLEIILMTAFGNITDAVQAMKNGAYDYLVKGDDNEKIIPLVYKAMEKAQDNAAKKAQKTTAQKGFEAIIGISPLIVQAKKLAEKVAVTDATVLLTGETGTGKEVFANAIHQGSERKKNNFVAINCSAFSREILESELFGHKAGAFTGAVKDKKGLIEEANGGTLFLDEIGEMPVELQAKLLRVLETREFIKMGETKVSKSDFRLVAATNRDLEEEIRQGNFREDLYFRLNIFEIRLPALRERKEDLKALAKNFIDLFSQKLHISGLQVDPEYFRILGKNDWKGNIRELRNTVERSLILMNDHRLDAESLPDYSEKNSPGNDSLSMKSLEKEHIQKVLQYTKGNKAEASRLLEIGIATLYRKLEEYGLR